MLRDIGLVVNQHLQAGICIKCKTALEPAVVHAHVKNNHKYFYEGTGASLPSKEDIVAEILSLVHPTNAATMEEIESKQKHALVTGLPVSFGFACMDCPRCRSSGPFIRRRHRDVECHIKEQADLHLKKFGTKPPDVPPVAVVIQKLSSTPGKKQLFICSGA